MFAGYLVYRQYKSISNIEYIQNAKIALFFLRHVVQEKMFLMVWPIGDSVSDAHTFSIWLAVRASSTHTHTHTPHGRNHAVDYDLPDLLSVEFFYVAKNDFRHPIPLLSKELQRMFLIP